MRQAIFIVVNPGIQRFIDDLTLDDIVDGVGMGLSIYELVGLLTSPRCGGCGERKVFVLGFDFCVNCKNASGRLFLAF